MSTTMKIIRTLLVITLIVVCDAHVLKHILENSRASLAAISNIVHGGGISVEVQEIDSAPNLPVEQRLPVKFEQVPHPPPGMGPGQWMQMSHQTYDMHQLHHHHINTLHKNRHGEHGGGYWGSGSYGLSDNTAPETTPSYTVVIIEESSPQEENNYGLNLFGDFRPNQVNYGKYRPGSNGNMYNGGFPNSYQPPHQGQQQPNDGKRHPNGGQQQPNYGYQPPNYEHQQKHQDNLRPDNGNSQENSGHQQISDNKQPPQHGHNQNDKGSQQGSSGNMDGTDQQKNLGSALPEYAFKPPGKKQENSNSAQTPSNAETQPVPVPVPGSQTTAVTTARPIRENNNFKDSDANESEDFAIDVRSGFDHA